MKARIVEVDGTPEEVAQFWNQVQGGAPPDEIDSPPSGLDYPLPDELHEWLRFWKVRDPQKQYITDVVENLMELGDVEVKILAGRGEDRFSGRIRLVRSDRREAFGILGRRGVLYLQLPENFDVSGYNHARVRDAKNTRHPVKMFVRSPEAVKEATELLTAAYNLQLDD